MSRVDSTSSIAHASASNVEKTHFMRKYYFPWFDMFVRLLKTVKDIKNTENCVDVLMSAQLS